MRIRNQCLNPVILKKVTGVNEPVLRCGKCSNCLRQKSNELAVRAQREYHGQSVVFLTFTYNDDMMPIRHFVYEVDTDTGEIFRTSENIERGTEFFDEAPFETRVYYQNGVKKLKRYSPLITEEEVFIGRSVIDVKYFTVYYEDIKLLFKRFRQRFPDALNKWICVPEYGGKSYRPHYHLMAFGLSKEQIHSLAIDWQSHYGKTDIRILNDKDDVGKISMYVAKYCTKGAFDCPYISAGYCIKPRRGISQNFGCGSPLDWQKYIEYVCAFDAFGNYDPLTVDPECFSDRHIKFLISRRKYLVNNIPYPNPKFLLKKVFNLKQKCYVYFDEKADNPFQGKFVYRSVASPLQRKIAQAILADITQDARQRRRQVQDFIKSREFLDGFDSGVYPDPPCFPVPVEVSSVPFDTDFQARIEASSIF